MAELPPFQTLIDEHAAAVMAVLRGAVGREGAEDAFQETFLAALRAYPSLGEARNLRGWLVTIAHRKAIDVLRARKRQPAPVEEVPDKPAALGVPGAAGVPDAQETDLWQAVAALPDKQRQAVAYHYVAGLPYAEIARLLGGTTDAARRAAADGIKSLRKSYQGATTEGAPS